jgi:hypothetical protein
VTGRRVVAGLIAALVIVGCGGSGDEPTASTVDPDAFVGTASTVGGEQIDLAVFAERDLVVWFWAPW